MKLTSRKLRKPTATRIIICEKSLKIFIFKIPGITYAGNHGLEIHHSDGTKFQYQIEGGGNIQDLKKALESEVCLDGAWVEDKGQLLTYHYRNVDAEKRPPLVEKAKNLIIEHGFKVGLAHCALECKPEVKWDKGRASIYILRTAFGVDWAKR